MKMLSKLATGIAAVTLAAAPAMANSASSLSLAQPRAATATEEGNHLAGGAGGILAIAVGAAAIIAAVIAIDNDDEPVSP